MSRLHRLLLIWLVALALPLQGAAAALRLGCLPDRAQGPAQHQPAQAAGHMDHGGHHAAAGHAHPGDPVATAGQSDMADSASPDMGQRHSTPHTCSACAACCLGAVLLAPPLSPALVTPVAQGLVFQALQVGPVRFVTDGPDRPPRSQPA